MTQELKISLTKEQALEFLEWADKLPHNKIMENITEAMAWKFGISYDMNTGRYTYDE